MKKSLFPVILSVMTVMLLITGVNAQQVGNSQPVIGEPQQLLYDSVTNMTPAHQVVNQVGMSSYNARYYQWERPVFEVVDVDRLLPYKSSGVEYLEEVKVLEALLKRNNQELKNYQGQVKDFTKVLKNERKNLRDKRKFFKDDEKILKREKSLRDKEFKTIRKERKLLKKASKTMTSWQMEEQLQKLNEREYRLQYAEEGWNIKWSNLKENVSELADVERVLNDKDYELKERTRELSSYEQEIKLKRRQLSLEKKQARNEIKREKQALKAIK